MFKKTLFSLAVIGACVLGFSSLPSSAATFAMPQPGVNTSSDLLTTVDTRRERMRRDNRVERRLDRAERRWDRRRHGIRCTRWNNNCRHFYRGYYYATPWWTLPLIGGSIVLGSRNYDGGGYGSAHVRWCLDRYRSYNVRTNTWVSYSGEIRQCRSPYM